MLRLIPCGVLAGLLATAAPADAFAPDAKLELAGPEEVVIDATRMKCAGRGEIDVTDMPVSAYRLPNGKVRLLAGNSRNWFLEGDTLDGAARRSCTPLIEQNPQSDPSKFQDKEWLMAVHVNDNREAVGFIHNEYHGYKFNDGCEVGDQGRTSRGRRDRAMFRCWYAATTHVRSRDGGVSFSRVPPPANVLAALPYKFNDKLVRAGNSAPKVVENPVDGMVYLLTAQGDRNKDIRGGLCLHRSKSLDVNDWTRWDGKNFVPYRRSPYTTQPPDPSYCTVVVEGNISTIRYVPRIKAFVALQVSRNTVSYRWSPDLITWSAPQQLMTFTSRITYRQEMYEPDLVENVLRRQNELAPSDPRPIWYFSLLDPTSGSRNFDTLEDRPYLYFVRYHLKDGRIINRSRDLIRVPLRIATSH